LVAFLGSGKNMNHGGHEVSGSKKANWISFVILGVLGG
jgi:hypothetical protein